MVESILLTNKISGAKLELDSMFTPYYILESVDWGQVKGSFQTYKYVNQAGESVENVLFGTRPISILGWIIANTEEEMTSRKQFLNLFVNPQQEIALSYDAYKLNFYPQNSVQYGAIMKENNEVIVKFKISGVCYDPMFRKEHDNMTDVASIKGYFHFPLIIEQETQAVPQIIFGLRQPSLITTIVNEGQIATGFKVVFLASGPRIVNPIFLNATTQEFIKINKVMQRGERIEVNTNRGERSIRGTLNKVTSNYSRYRDLDMSWIQLEPGENVFRYDAEEGVTDLDVYVYHNDKFLEVQKCY